MGKDRRAEKSAVDEALGKQQDKFGKKGDGKKAPTQGPDKSFSHQEVRRQHSSRTGCTVVFDNFFEMCMRAALRRLRMLAVPTYSRAEAVRGAAHQRGDPQWQNNIQRGGLSPLGGQGWCAWAPRVEESRRARSGLLEGGARMQGGRLAVRATSRAVTVSPLAAHALSC